MNKLYLFLLEINPPETEWAVIDGTNGKYYISSFGEVVSYIKGKPYLLSPWIADNGYYKVSIKQYGKRKHLYIHSLVA